LLGALVLSRGGYSWLMWTAAAVFLASALTVLVVPRPGSVAVAHSSPGGTPVLLTVSVTLFFTATFAGGLALPLFLTRALHQQPASVGVLFSVCAAVEVVAFRGVGIAIVGAAGIRYFQDLLAPATGRATTLFANASTAGLLASGILSGVAVEQLGYRTTFFRCGVAAALGGVAFTLGSRSQAGRRHLQKVRPHVQRGGEDRTGVSPTVLPPGSGIVCIVCRDYRRRT
jgi:SET family sugar efflux transporter-like MFS transporter